jgi:DNA-binding IclR family transcriptional regulator
LIRSSLAALIFLQHLVLDGPATATECAEVAGLSPSPCSYHLRALARHGFVEETPSVRDDQIVYATEYWTTLGGDEP